ncbi:hypothetical protein EVAR_9937_1 [Eumeta japonica]|uniref:Uncharacterized protein n=1 Tax=Eumeta variegata TaxID=151549 RepID=A0A4C1TQZ8_EUMVA|nr:hypothetical protein EVAR_9937_1 [Eumeta japonica]
MRADDAARRLNFRPMACTNESETPRPATAASGRRLSRTKRNRQIAMQLRPCHSALRIKHFYARVQSRYTRDISPFFSSKINLAKKG